MGEITDAIIDGEFDEITGEYIGSPCGYPRTTKGSRRNARTQSGKNKVFGSQLTEETKVVWNYMLQKYAIDDAQKSKITKLYGAYKQWQSDKASTICKSIRETKESWSEFKFWMKENSENKK